LLELGIIMASYSERYHALCDIIDELRLPPGESDNRFQLGVASGSRDIQSYKLDHFLSTYKSRKGKEVERYGEWSGQPLGDSDRYSTG
jgi:hypothetical protein